MHDSTNEDQPVEDVEAQQRSFAEGDLGTIQTILFGNQAQQFELRIAQLEERFNSALHVEQELRIAAVDELRQQQREGSKELGEAIGTAERNAERSREEMRLQFADKWDNATNELHDLRRQVDSGRAEMLSRLDELGAQRETIAELLERTAAQLRSDLHSREADL